MVSAVRPQDELSRMIAPESRNYRADEVIAFRKTGEAFGGLSNMAPGFPLRVAGIDIRTVEALYQACRYPHLPDIQRDILSESSPMTAKMRSKPHRADTRPRWDELRVPLMKWCLRVKLAQNWTAFGDLLRSTGDKAIVEDSRKDDFWGAVSAADGTLSGRNVLGRLLMELRNRLSSDPQALETVTPLAVSRFTLLDRPIEPIAAETTPWYDKPVEAEPSTVLQFR